MGMELKPLYAANLAADAYLIKSSITLPDFIDAYKSDMDVSKSAFSPGVTGGYIIKKRHVMAVFSAGKGSRKGQAFVVFKGTASLYDAITDLNTGVKPSHTGLPVHQGFFYAFDSVINELRQFLRGLEGVSTIHCVGHSLGGAIATLAADWIKSSGGSPTVNLYTFGSPRVGMGRFAEKCTSRLHVDNIYRVYHSSDPVPMVPTWPFSHVPNNDPGYHIYSPAAMPPWKYHFMEHYEKSAENVNCWHGLRAIQPQTYGQVAIENWLKSDGVISLTANTLQILNAALLYVLKKVGHAAGIITVGYFASQFTLLDRLAMILKKAANISASVSFWVFRLIKRMAALIGMTVKEGADLTVQFIRTIFMFLHQRVSDMVQRVGRQLG